MVCIGTIILSTAELVLCKISTGLWVPITAFFISAYPIFTQDTLIQIYNSQGFFSTTFCPFSTVIFLCKSNTYQFFIKASHFKICSESVIFMFTHSTAICMFVSLESIQHPKLYSLSSIM